MSNFARPQFANIELTSRSANFTRFDDLIVRNAAGFTLVWPTTPEERAFGIGVRHPDPLMDPEVVFFLLEGRPDYVRPDSISDNDVAPEREHFGHHAFVYNFVKMAESMASFRRELLETVMHPRRVHGLPLLGLVN